MYCQYGGAFAAGCASGLRWSEYAAEDLANMCVALPDGGAPDAEVFVCHDDCDLASTTPVCAGGVCRGCVEDGECGLVEGICDESSGRCVGESEILYVSAGGVAGSCSKQAPCGLPSQAVDAVTTQKRFVKIGPGLYMDHVLIQNKTVELVGTGVSLTLVRGYQADKPVIDVIDQSTVGISGMQVDAATGNGDGVHCLGQGVDKTQVAVRDAAVAVNAGDGIDASGCAVMLERARIADNTLEGVRASSGALTMNRVEITNNSGGGVDIDVCDFALRNVFITANGSSTTPSIGGVLIRQAGLSGASASFLEFVTIAGNRAKMGAGASGLFCLSATAVRSSIVASNVASLSNQVGGACTFEHSLIDAAPALSGTDNQVGDPKFAIPESDFHIQTGSACVGVGDPNSTVHEDIDGNVRPAPAGSPPDCGADEIP